MQLLLAACITFDSSSSSSSSSPDGAQEGLRKMGRAIMSRGNGAKKWGMPLCAVGEGDRRVSRKTSCNLQHVSHLTHLLQMELKKDREKWDVLWEREIDVSPMELKKD
ncbi:hypothetical protein MUK42_22932 [Musa troglodytarum]|uniref:Uncharacterized protein n=1 Tax=Musa troglodytarum TaxID=320322 RepID=A0A9E7G077_9LILI|nr:hypothetical protein MUK42_22932 [Musa troglodytarum]